MFETAFSMTTTRLGVFLFSRCNVLSPLNVR
jgi:hypothetical protein